MSERQNEFEGLGAVKSEILASRAQIEEPDSVYTVRVRVGDELEQVRGQVDAWLEELDGSGYLNVRADIEFESGPIPAYYLTEEEAGDRLSLTFEPEGFAELREEDILSSGEVYMMGKKLMEAFKRARAGEKDVKFSMRRSDLDKWVTPNNYLFPKSLNGVWPEELRDKAPFSKLLERFMNWDGGEKINYKRSPFGFIFNPTLLD